MAPRTTAQSGDSPAVDASTGAPSEPITVRRGDSWASVAERTGVDVAALVAANGGHAAEPLIVGQQLARP